MASGAVASCAYSLLTLDTPYTYSVFEDRIANSQKWTSESPLTNDRWQISLGNTHTGQLALRARNVASLTDQYLTLKDPVLLNGTQPGLLFWHNFRTEGNVDGGVIEISTDNGTTWEYITSDRFIENGYQGLLSLSDNPLAGLEAFSGISQGWIRTLVDLTPYAGQEVKIRFRFGTNSSGARDGWYLDDISLLGDLVTIANRACTHDDELLCSAVTTVIWEPEVVATNEPSASGDWQVYPNPTFQFLHIAPVANSARQAATATLYTLDGKIALNRQLAPSQETEWDISNLPNGVYLLKIQGGSGVYTERVVKM
ncbi:MAG: T9SS type A sorting domain-containing protein [Saprospiraceae bacterium]